MTRDADTPKGHSRTSWGIRDETERSLLPHNRRNVSASLITGLSAPTGVALSGSDLFVASFSGNTIGERATRQRSATRG